MLSRGKRSWATAAALAVVLGGLLGVTVPANAAIHSITGSVTAGTYKYYWNTFRYHSVGGALWTFSGFSPHLGGGAMHFGLWNGTGGETNRTNQNSVPSTVSLYWIPSGNYTLPTDTYAMFSGSSGVCGGCTLTISFSGSLNF